MLCAKRVQHRDAKTHSLTGDLAPLKPKEGLNGPPALTPLKPKEGLNGPPSELFHSRCGTTPLNGKNVEWGTRQFSALRDIWVSERWRPNRLQ